MCVDTAAAFPAPARSTVKLSYSSGTAMSRLEILNYEGPIVPANDLGGPRSRDDMRDIRRRKAAVDDFVAARFLRPQQDSTSFNRLPVSN